jgi:hypothetical protein
MIKALLATAIFALVAATAPSYAEEATTKDQLIGSWKIISLKATTGDVTRLVPRCSRVVWRWCFVLFAHHSSNIR